MRDIHRSALLLIAATVMALTALLPSWPGSVAPRSAAPRNAAPAQIRALVAKADAVQSEAEPETDGSGDRGATPEPQAVVATPKAVVKTGAPSAEDESDSATFVASVDTLGTDDVAPPEPASDGQCPKARTCPTNQIRTQKWKTSEDGTVTIPWRFNDEGRRNLRAPAGLLESAVRASMAEWSRWNSNIVFEYSGTTTAAFAAQGKDGSCDDGVNTVTWASFDPSVIAAVGTCIDPATNTVRDADLALNVTQHWEDISGEAESRHTFDIRSIVTHELGHILSLLDLYDARSVRQTMMGSAEYGETRKRTLALGDVIGLQKAYPCDAQDRCPRDGISDD